MIRIAFTNPTHHTISWVPVMVPLMALVALTGAVRVGSEIATHANQVANRGQVMMSPTNTPLTTNHFNSTESTFVKYEKAGEMSQAGQDKETLTLLTSVIDMPVCMDGNAFHATELHGFSPMSLMLGLANTLKRRIDTATAKGDVDTARQYVDTLYRIGDHLARTQTPTIESVKVAHNYHSMAAQIDASLMPQADSYGNLAMQYEIATLRSFWEKEIAPQLGAINAQDNAPQRDLAMRLAREYQDEWTRIRAGEV